MNKSKTKSKNKMVVSHFSILGLTSRIVIALVLLLLVSSLLSACSTTQTDEPKWTDFYEVKSYEIKTETITNEIITTVFMAKYTETNKVVVVKDQYDFGGYEFEPIEEKPCDFQCVGDTCEVKK